MTSTLVIWDDKSSAVPTRPVWEYRTRFGNDATPWPDNDSVEQFSTDITLLSSVTCNKFSWQWMAAQITILNCMQFDAFQLPSSPLMLWCYRMYLMCAECIHCSVCKKVRQRCWLRTTCLMISAAWCCRWWLNNIKSIFDFVFVHRIHGIALCQQLLRHSGHGSLCKWSKTIHVITLPNAANCFSRNSLDHTVMYIWQG